MKEPPWTFQKKLLFVCGNQLKSLSFLFLVVLSRVSECAQDDASDTSPSTQPRIAGGKLEFNKVEGEKHSPIIGYSSTGTAYVIPGRTLRLGLFGEHLEEVNRILYFKDLDNGLDRNCSGQPAAEANINRPHADNLYYVESVAFVFPTGEHSYYLCVEHKETEIFTDDHMLVMTMYKQRSYYMPVPVQVCFIAFLLVLSGLFSGLNLGLMALDPTELELVKKSGTPNERRDADTILPVRKTGNYLLCSLLLGNVIVNSAISILFDDLTTGYIALVVSTFGIVIFGEIVPQSVCNKKGLAVGARTIWLTRFFMILTFPLSYPIGKILDCVLGAEAGRVYNRERLMELIKMSVQQQTDGTLADEFRIVSGALEIHNKTVKDIMTKIEDVFMLPSDATLNVNLVADVVQNGYTRIPVFEGNDRNRVIALLNVKDLALLDPDDNLTVKTVCDYWHHPLRFIMEDTPLKVMLDEFKKGHYHLALVQKIEVYDDKDPAYVLSGLVTLEDIIEEILQAEIVDETDIVTDNVQRKRRKDAQLKDLSKILVRESSTEGSVSIQLQLAAAQWLSTNMHPFHEDYISTTILQRIISRNARSERPSTMFDRQVSAAGGEKKLMGDMEYKELFADGVASDKFVLILEGRVEVKIGKSGMTFEAGPFHSFGKEVMEKMVELAPKMTLHGGHHVERHLGGSSVALTHKDEHIGSARKKSEFLPDFTVYVKSDVTYLMISASTYLSAYRLSLIENQKGIVVGSGATPNSPSSTEVSIGRTLENGPRGEQGTRPSLDLSPSRHGDVGLSRNADSSRATIGSPKEIKDKWLSRGLSNLELQKVVGRPASAEHIADKQKKRMSAGVERIGLIDLDAQKKAEAAKKRSRTASSGGPAPTNIIIRMKDKFSKDKDKEEKV